MDCLQTVDIGPNCPWILQQYLNGREYSCYTVADEGRIVAHSDNIASLSCLNFGHVDSREIAEWMETFCSKLKLTGQVGVRNGSIWGFALGMPLHSGQPCCSQHEAHVLDCLQLVCIVDVGVGVLWCSLLLIVGVLLRLAMQAHVPPLASVT